MDLYILYVKTGKEEYIKELLTRRLEQNKYSLFVPTKNNFFIRKNIKYIKKKICFPGYIFIESNCNSMELFGDVSNLIKQISDAYYFLYYDNKSQIIMRKEEQVFLKKLLGDYNCIEESIGFIEGDKIKITSGALIGLESIIKKINRHTREAILDINIMGDTRQIKIALEIIKKI